MSHSTPETDEGSAMPGVFCPQCSHRNPSGANFCTSCGSALLTAGEDLTVTLHDPRSTPDAEVVVRVVADTAVLVVNRGPETGQSFLLERDLTSAGRATDADIFLDDVTVSRRHAEILRDGDVFMIRDAGSLNGTYVNGERVDEAKLHSGDEIQVGKFHLVFLSSRQI
jgi:pSer/pThr/pTyr-binding forkhead associated (FHA) protein